MEKILFMGAKVQEVKQAYDEYVNWCDDVVVSLHYKVEGEKDMWLSIYQRDNMPCFYLSNEDIFDKLLRIRQNPEVLRYRIGYFYGFKLDWYEAIYPALYRLIDSLYAKLIKMVCYIARENSTAINFINNNKGKLVNNIYVPTTDIEELFLQNKLGA